MGCSWSGIVRVQYATDATHQPKTPNLSATPASPRTSTHHDAVVELDPTVPDSRGICTTTQPLPGRTLEASQISSSDTNTAAPISRLFPASTDFLEYNDVTWDLLKDHFAGLCENCNKLLQGEHCERFDLVENCWFCDTIRDACIKVSDGCDECSNKDKGIEFNLYTRATTSPCLCFFIYHHDSPSISKSARVSVTTILYLSQRVKPFLGLDPRILSFARSRLTSCLAHTSCKHDYFCGPTKHSYFLLTCEDDEDIGR
ncbi:hypothetical protein QBC38DRAFT_45665 [Podospora fimiseda]|uniref:Uncharacterized protein n=1 Tax=Podospora fimiseda TaxID=252190 RepID=A0AAN7BHX6_9PEZI|nr:hypothetical protein QBC38DRAFT_45665 [Podospora fimiseda]